MAYLFLYHLLILPLVTRDEVECDLNFLGLLVMENRLKLESRPVLRELINSRIRTVMITGMILNHSGTQIECLFKIRPDL